MPTLSDLEYNKSTDITKSNTVNLPLWVQNQWLTDAIYVGGAGTVTVVFADDTTQQFTAAAASFLNVPAKRVNSTGTAATAMVALYIV